MAQKQSKTAAAAGNSNRSASTHQQAHSPASSRPPNHTQHHNNNHSQTPNRLAHLFSEMACKTAHFAGKPLAFLVAVMAVVVWALTGPMFGYSDTWQLV